MTTRDDWQFRADILDSKAEALEAEANVLLIQAKRMRELSSLAAFNAMNMKEQP